MIARIGIPAPVINNSAIPSNAPHWGLLDGSKLGESLNMAARQF